MVVVQDVALALHEAEIAIDTAIAKANALAAMLPASGAMLKLSPTVTQPAFDDVHSVLTALNTSRSRAVQLHAVLDDLKNKSGLKNFVVAIGDLWKGVPKPTGALTTLNDDQIRAARSAA